MLRKGSLSSFVLNDEEYTNEVIEDTEKYLIANPNIREEIDKYVLAYRALLDLLPQTVNHFWSGHVFPYTESMYELEASMYFVKTGFYKHAINALRSVLELGILSVYWDINDRSYLDIQNWLKSEEDTPFKKEIVDRLLVNKNIKEYCNKTNFIDNFNDLYKKICNYTHTKGGRFSSRRLGNSNVNNFKSDSVNLWLSYFKSVVVVIVTLHVLKYPVSLQFTPMEEKFGMNGPAGGFLNTTESENIKSIFSPQLLKILQSISDNDPDAISMAEWVNDHPDISPEEEQEQVDNFEKEMVLMGPDGWEGYGKRKLKEIKEFEKTNKVAAEWTRRSYENLKKWAETDEYKIEWQKVVEDRKRAKI